MGVFNRGYKSEMAHSNYSLNLIEMEPMEDENCIEEFEEVYRISKTADDATFDLIIMELQDILIDPQFEKTLAGFMKNNWSIFDGPANKQNESKVFEQFRTQLKNYLQTKIREKLRDFAWPQFWNLLEKRKHLVDEQMLDTLLSLEDVEHFKAFIKDFRNSHEEEEMFKVLTVKSNKISEIKKVKGKTNIFANDAPPMFDSKLTKPIIKRKPAAQKTEDELLFPELILTVKPLRKG